MAVMEGLVYLTTVFPSFPVHFRYVVFHPFLDEILIGKIKGCSPEGVHGKRGDFWGETRTQGGQCIQLNLPYGIRENAQLKGQARGAPSLMHGVRASFNRHSKDTA